MTDYSPIWIKLVLVTLVLAFGALLDVKSIRKARREAYIEKYAFRQELLDKLGHHFPHLTKPQIEQVINGLRYYFILRLQHGDNIAMPSKVVDALWHDFILFTKDYQVFCEKAFGGFLHHMPYTSMTSPADAHSSLLNVWRYCCEQEGVNPIIPQRLPLLFKLDNELGIPDSFGYSVEQFIYPKLNTYIITPDSLCQGINEKMRKDDKRQAYIGLAPIVKPYLLDDKYCKSHGGTALSPLFDAVLRYENLAVAIFGSIELARERQQQAKNFPDPASCG